MSVPFTSGQNANLTIVAEMSLDIPTSAPFAAMSQTLDQTPPCSTRMASSQTLEAGISEGRRRGTRQKGQQTFYARSLALVGL